MATPSQSTQKGVFIIEASVDDVPAIKSMVDSAYSKYIDRIGQPPAPMLEDYYSVLQTSPVFVLKDNNHTSIGAIMFSCDNGTMAMKIKNLVVSPAAQGRGYGRVLMNYAENFAISQNILALELYTNVKMHENIQLYAKLGFSEEGRRTEDGFERVYFRKDLSRGEKS
ncbi:acyl-CoA N-acyltransferase [Penicillium waksmanii]|uniref:acyl-CoA N-acyltransferase n=1 Tax=Penicillium waksmanii TaxID=69791 RepID=UPI00254906AC|nr:acyl-CoA N-acyltransferase [Penicillium waksmanii]KAJ5975559.1 acyl-CoA N-acyltransferase [Penicillium waksmanii]